MTYIIWTPEYDGHAPKLKTIANVEFYGNGFEWENCSTGCGWCATDTYRFPAEDLMDTPRQEDAFEAALAHVEDIYAGPDIVPPEPTECWHCDAPLKDDKSSGGSLPDNPSLRNEYPMADGLLDYFPNALAEVSRLSHVATQQHHPDQPMHWDRGKSLDHANKIIRHLVDRGKLDDKGMRHSAMVAWRALALLQQELEEQEGIPASRASRNVPN